MKYLLCGLAISIWAITISCTTFRNTTDFFTAQAGFPLQFETYSGYEDIDWYLPNSTASMYYSLWGGFGEKFSDHSIPLIVWLQGGPGTSSQFGCFNEVGPLYINGSNQFNLMANSWGWNFFGHLLCVDQPVGVGFSFNKGDMVSSSVIAAKHFVNFLYNFYKHTPWNLNNNPLYIAGQDYAGHYIPAIVNEMYSNKYI